MGELAERSLGVELYAIGEIVDHASLPVGEIVDHASLPIGEIVDHADPSREPPYRHEDKADNRGEVFGPSLPEDAAVVGTCGIGQRVLASGLREPADSLAEVKDEMPHPTIPGTGDL